MRRLNASLVGCTLALLVLAITGITVPTRAASITLKVWTFWSTQWLQPTFDRFEKLHPGVKVQHEQLTWDNGLDKITTAIAAKNGPDVMELGSTWIPQFMSSKALAPIPVQDIASDMTGLGSVTRAGHTYAIPWFGTANVVYYNKELFDKAKITRVPRNWEELLRASQRIHALGKDVYGFSLKIGGRYTTWQKFLPFVWSNGGEVLNDDWTKPLVTTAPFVQALDFYKKLAASSLVGTQEEARQAFYLGKLGMIFDGSGLDLAKNAPDLKYGTFLLPPSGKPGTKSVVFSGADYLAVWSGSREQALAAELAKMLARGNVISSHVPALISFSRTDQKAHLAQHPDMQIFIEAMANATHPPMHPRWEDIATAISKAVEGVLLGQYPNATVALKDAEKAIIPMLKD